MFFLHAAIAFVLATIAIAILSAGIRVRIEHRPLWAIFVVLFLVIWSGGIWIAPFGPAVGGVYWVPFTLIAILVAIFLAAVVPPRVHTHAQAVERESEIAAGLGVFFWVLVIALMVGIVLRYMR